MKKTIALCFLTFVIGLGIGWFALLNKTENQRRIESMLLLDKANTSAEACDYSAALIYAAQSFALYKDSPLSGFMLDELVNKKPLFEKRCDSRKAQ